MFCTNRQMIHLISVFYTCRHFNELMFGGKNCSDELASDCDRRKSGGPAHLTGRCCLPPR